MGSWFGQDLSVWSLHVLPVSACVSSRFSGFLPQSKDKLQIGVGLIGEFKLSASVNVSDSDSRREDGT